VVAKPLDIQGTYVFSSN